jgi:hypothetical protein
VTTLTKGEVFFFTELVCLLRSDTSCYCSSAILSNCRGNAEAVNEATLLFQEYGEVRFEAYFKHKASLFNTLDESSGSESIAELMKAL